MDGCFQTPMKSCMAGSRRLNFMGQALEPPFHPQTRPQTSRHPEYLPTHRKVSGKRGQRGQCGRGCGQAARQHPGKLHQGEHPDLGDSSRLQGAGPGVEQVNTAVSEMDKESRQEGALPPWASSCLTSSRSLKVIVHTLDSVFPHVTAWTSGEVGDMVFLARKGGHWRSSARDSWSGSAVRQCKRISSGWACSRNSRFLNSLSWRNS